MAAIGVCFAPVAVSLLIDCACDTGDAIKEATSSAQIEFYRAAVMLGMLVWDRSPPLVD